MEERIRKVCNDYARGLLTIDEFASDVYWIASEHGNVKTEHGKVTTLVPADLRALASQFPYRPQGDPVVTGAALHVLVLRMIALVAA